VKSNIHLIGNAHLDPAWLWRLDEGFEAFLATCRSALDRMRETPGFIFSCSSAACYEFVEQTDRALFTQIQDAVREGKWEIVGGWWVEPDCNIPTGESFIRQALYGQRYFKSKFGKICSVGYCIDSFGHNANLPQLLKQAGMNAYVFMRPEEPELNLPQSLFRWQASGGDEVLAYRIPFHYSNFRHSITEKLSLLQTSPDYIEHIPWMLFYGVGNHGGGPTKQQIVEILEQDLHMSRLDNFFVEARSIRETLPVYQGELQHHAIGCYSNHAKLKAANRRAEHALMRAEKFSVLSEVLTGQSVNVQAFDQAWKNVLLNQFHDVLGGVSTEEVCEDALNKYGEAISIASRNEHLALQRIRNNIDTSDAIESLIVFNPQLQSYRGPIEFELWNPEGSEKGKPIEGVILFDDEENAISTQQIEAGAKIGPDRVRFIANCDIPSFGWKRYEVKRSPSTKWESRVTVNDKLLKNEKIGFSLSREATITGNVLAYSPLEVFRDESDSWAHGQEMFADKIGEFLLRKVEVVDEGPIRGSVRLISEYNLSRCEQLISLHSDSDEITIKTTLDWHEPNAICKMSFPHEMKSPHFICDIPYGILERPINGKEYPAVSWGFVSDAMRGLGIISDSKSSFSCNDRSLSFVIARSPLYAHHVPPHISKPHETQHYLDHGRQQTITKIVLGHLSHQDARMSVRSLVFHEQPVAVIESAHGGNLGKVYSGAGVVGDGIVVTVVKHAADGEGSVVRLFESTGNKQSGQVVLDSLNTVLNISLSPYEIKTYRIAHRDVTEISCIEDGL
jgi:alpha-mannosidase